VELVKVYSKDDTTPTLTLPPRRGREFCRPAAAAGAWRTSLRLPGRLSAAAVRKGAVRQ
jgi:hypothetical protein